jgi:heme-degrading monooxygenase HmoA
MSVIMTLELAGDPKAVEQFASDNKDSMQAILEAAKRHGLIAHRFYGSADGRRLAVMDEWPDQESFEAFFREQEAQIQPIMQAAGIASESQPNFWHKLETHDAYGWGA